MTSHEEMHKLRNGTKLFLELAVVRE